MVNGVWKPGDVIVWRGIYQQRVWNAMPVIVVKDTPEEIALALLPGAEGMAPEGYSEGKQNGKRRWDFKYKRWKVEQYTWHTNRLLLILEPQKYYSTMLFWNAKSGEFICYYVNFQIPFKRSRCGVDTLDLELDLIIHPDYSYDWKDLDDYMQAIDHGVTPAEWINEIDEASLELMAKLEKREYPLDGSWLDWKPDRDWVPPKLPEGWDKV
jgi:protein associated with RNAse G/E